MGLIGLFQKLTEPSQLRKQERQQQKPPRREIEEKIIKIKFFTKIKDKIKKTTFFILMTFNPFLTHFFLQKPLWVKIKNQKNLNFI